MGPGSRSLRSLVRDDSEYADRDPRFALSAPSMCNCTSGMTRFRASVHHDLHLVAHLDLGVLLEAVEDAEALGRAVDAAHAVGERFDGIAGLHRDDLEAQRARGLDFLQRQAAEGIDRLARIAFALGGLRPRSEDEAVDVGA